jgi:Ni,Fe-hydrogenase I small subunit
MKAIIEKQILEWKEELAKQVKTKEQAEKVLAESNRNILMIEGGLQAKELLLNKINTQSQENLKKQVKTNKNN